jgi:DNA-binding IclR family transcriptional regulator
MTITDVKRDAETGQYTLTLTMTEVDALALAQSIISAAEVIITPDTPEEPTP